MILGNINDNNEDKDVWKYEEIEQENVKPKPLEVIVTNNNNVEDINIAHDTHQDTKRH